MKAGKGESEDAAGEKKNWARIVADNVVRRWRAGRQGCDIHFPAMACERGGGGRASGGSAW